MPSTLRQKLRRATEVSPAVTAFRARQEARLAWLDVSNGWDRLAARTAADWTPELTARFRRERWGHSGLLAPDGADALAGSAAAGTLDRAAYVAWGRRYVDGDLVLLGAPVPAPGEGPPPWRTDWRHGHTWPERPFRQYDFYERDKSRPYDVKFPWELGRFGFAPAWVQAAVIDPGGAGDLLARLDGLLADWEARNPMAHTVQWVPMEAAMRTVSLCLTLELLAAVPGGPVPAGLVERLVRMVDLNTRFLWRTLEYTEPRGNHYAANVAALVLAGLALRGYVPEAARWLSWGRAALDEEPLLQYSADGVQFEKSIPYHRLVTELFLVAAVALDRAGLPIAPAAEARLRAACVYAAWYHRPDGRAPNWGDNDGAHVLALDPLPVADHRPMLALAAGYWGDGELARADSAVERSSDARPAAAATPHGIGSAAPAAVAWLLGQTGLDRLVAAAGGDAPADDPPHPPTGVRHFSAGGVVVARADGDYLLQDLGEVGLAGRGGHGHNDLLSFELCLNGRAVVVDRGCPVYTGDPAKRNAYRATAAHSVAQVDGREMGVLGGMWQIRPAAEPRDVWVERSGAAAAGATHARVRTHGCHAGYGRDDDVVTICRDLDFDPTAGRLTVVDRWRAEGTRTVVRRLHLAPGLAAEVDAAAGAATGGGRGGAATVTGADGFRCGIEWDDPATAARVVTVGHSDGYGEETTAPALELTDRVEGPGERSLTIQRKDDPTP